MSVTWTNYGRDRLLAALVTPDTYEPPIGMWVLLSLTLLVKNSTEDMIDEPDPSCGYRRLRVPLGSAFWTPNGFGEYSNNSPTSDALDITEDSGLILGWGLIDNGLRGAGNLWAVGTLNSPIVLSVQSSPYTADDMTLGLYD